MATPAPTTLKPAERLYFRPRHRLSHAREFERVFANKLSRARGPLVVHALATELPQPRLGLSIGRRVGNAVARNRLKRFIREAFRLNQLALRPGTDFIVSVRPHKALDFADYQRHFLDAAAAVSAKLPASSPPAPPAPPSAKPPAKGA